MIPKVIHFVYVNFNSVCSRPFGIVHFLAIKSAKLVNNCEVILFHDDTPPQNEWWERSKEFSNHVKCQLPEHDGIETRSDLFKLHVLHESGGIYMDLDTLSVTPVDPFLDNRFVMGKEVVDGETLGLCNAVMMSEKISEFSRLWIDEYKDYDPGWGKMQVIRPYTLAQKYPELISVQPGHCFFKYTWKDEDLEKLFERVEDINDVSVLHLWEQISYDKYLSNMVFEKDSTYTRAARRFL